MTHQLANKFSKLVMVVDNNGEIAGGGAEPHACIGPGTPHAWRQSAEQT